MKSQTRAAEGRHCRRTAAVITRRQAWQIWRSIHVGKAGRRNAGRHRRQGVSRGGVVWCSCTTREPLSGARQKYQWLWYDQRPEANPPAAPIGIPLLRSFCSPSGAQHESVTTMTRPRTIVEKIWDDHVVSQDAGAPAVLAVDLHLVHEVTSPQAFSGLRARGLGVRHPERTVATADHSIPTHPRSLPIARPDGRRPGRPARPGTARSSASRSTGWARRARASST